MVWGIVVVVEQQRKRDIKDKWHVFFSIHANKARKSRESKVEIPKQYAPLNKYYNPKFEEVRITSIDP